MRYPFWDFETFWSKQSNPSSLFSKWCKFHGQNHQIMVEKGRFVMLRHHGVFLWVQPLVKTGSSIIQVCHVFEVMPNLKYSDTLHLFFLLGNIQQYFYFPPPITIDLVVSQVWGREFIISVWQFLNLWELVFKTCFYFVFISDSSSSPSFNEDLRRKSFLGVKNFNKNMTIFL